MSDRRLRRSMRPQRLLLPIDTRRCYLEIFLAAQTFARHPEGATVVLLHVVNLNIAAPVSRVYEQLGREARWHLERLAEHYLQPGLAPIVHVRFGNPAEEILAEASADNTDLIILPSRLPTLWQRLFPPVAPRVVETVIRRATCGVFLVRPKSRFDCLARWHRPLNEAGVPLECLGRTPEEKSSPVCTAKDAQASRAQPEYRVCPLHTPCIPLVYPLHPPCL